MENYTASPYTASDLGRFLNRLDADRWNDMVNAARADRADRVRADRLSMSLSHRAQDYAIVPHAADKWSGTTCCARNIRNNATAAHLIGWHYRRPEYESIRSEGTAITIVRRSQSPL